MKKVSKGIFLSGAAFVLVVILCTGCSDQSAVSMDYLQSAIASGTTSAGTDNRVLVVDARSSEDYIAGHITDALNVPLSMIAENGSPLYTNGVDEVSTTAATDISASWLCHLLINQLVNDYQSTYRDSEIIFYADTAANAKNAFEVALKAGFTDVSYLNAAYADWAAANSEYTAQYVPGIAQVDEENGTFVMNGYINSTNYDNVSTYGTHNCIIYEGGGSHAMGMFQLKTPPFCFQELLTYLGADPDGNMADGIDFGAMDEWSDKHVDGQRIDYSITWEGAEKYYTLAELLEEKPSAYQPDPEDFTTYGIEPRIGGTRDSNINWNPGCIYCSYSCVCGITSNAKVNDHTWFADGGIYDLMNYPEDLRNYYAGRFYPRVDILPDSGTALKVKVEIVD